MHQPVGHKNYLLKKTISIFTILILSNYEKNTSTTNFSIASLLTTGSREGNPFQTGCQG
jgi:hypothetical protein